MHPVLQHLLRRHRSTTFGPAQRHPATSERHYAAELIRRTLDRAGWSRPGERPDRGYSVASHTGSARLSVIDVEASAAALAGYRATLTAAGWQVTTSADGRELLVAANGPTGAPPWLERAWRPVRSWAAEQQQRPERQAP
jgi:hypothetical protein